MWVTYLVLSVLVNASQILCDSIIRSQVLLGEVHSFLVGEDGSGVRSQEFLLNTHVVVGDGKNCNFILVVVFYSAC